MMAMTMPVARTMIGATVTVAGTTMITRAAMIAAMAAVITATAADLEIDTLSRSWGRRSADIEKAGNSQQSQFLDHNVPSCEN